MQRDQTSVPLRIFSLETTGGAEVEKLGAGAGGVSKDSITEVNNLKYHDNSQTLYCAVLNSCFYRSMYVTNHSLFSGLFKIAREVQTVLSCSTAYFELRVSFHRVSTAKMVSVCACMFVFSPMPF